MLKHIMCQSVLVGVGLSSLITFGHAYGTTYYTALTGSDSNSCSSATSQSTPKRTIKASLTCLSAGDTLYIRGGQYPEQLHSLLGTTWPSGTNFTSGAITIAGYPGETVTINPSATGSTFDIIYIMNAQYLIFDNLTFDASNVNVTSGGIIFRPDPSATHIRLQNSILKNHSTGNGVLGPGPNEYVNNEIFGNRGYGLYITGDHNLIEGNYIHDNNGYAIHMYGSSVDCPPFNCVHDNVARNNRIVHNGFSNINPAGSCSVLAAAGANNQYYNNLIINGWGCGVQIYGYGTADSKVWQNTIVGHGGPCVDIQDPGGAPAVNTVVRNNICYNNGSDIIDNGRGSIISNNTSNATNPQFVKGVDHILMYER